MKLLEMTDTEILEAAEPILKAVVKGCNTKDWSLYSENMPEDDKTDRKHREHVENEWKRTPYLTALSNSPEFLGVIRKASSVIVTWKQSSEISSEQYLQKIHLEEDNGRLYQTAVWFE